jgi:hypothetical protein
MFSANTFQFPNFIVDETLNKISGNALKLLIIIMRKTRGFSGNAEAISLTQFKDMTKLSRSTIVVALAELERLNLIETTRNKAGNANVSSQYRLSSGLFGEFVRPTPAESVGSPKIELPPSSIPKLPPSSETGLVQNLDYPPSSIPKLPLVQKLNYPNRETRVRDHAPAPVDSEKILDSEKRRDWELFSFFIKDQTKSASIRDRRKYAAKLRVGLDKNDPYTIAMFGEWLKDYEADLKTFEAFRDRWLYQKIFLLTDDASRVTYVQNIEKTQDGDIIARLTDGEAIVKITESSIDSLELFLATHTSAELAPHITRDQIDYVDRQAAEARAKARPARPPLSHSERIAQ